MKISEAARLAGVSVRTLRYYDKIGLLSPQEVTSAGYRLYGRAELERLQEILFFRELDFPLEEIKAILDRFAALGDLPPESPQAQELVRAWQEHITRNYYRCTREILSGLGQMYLADDRFRENLDSHGPGTAERLAKAIEVYCG